METKSNFKIKNLKKYFDGWSWTIVGDDTDKTEFTYMTNHLGDEMWLKEHHMVASDNEFSLIDCEEKEARKIIRKWFERVD